MSLGITVGKFYPFHLGHDYLIREAKKRVTHLVVLVGYQPNQAIPGSKRANWIRSMHPDVEVIEVLDRKWIRIQAHAFRRETKNRLPCIKPMTSGMGHSEF